MKWFLLTLFSVAFFQSECINNVTRDRDGKLIFQVIKFPNDACTGTNSRNGTCYTSSECSTKGGTSAGTCASGYGVCCTFVIGCASSSSQNCTYIESSGVAAGNCQMKICKCSSNICQLRLDFQSFVINGPSTSTDVVATVTEGETIGAGIDVAQATQCLTDTFTVGGSASSNIPVLCGTLTGDHIYVDAGSNCNDLTFNLGRAAVGTTLAARSWQIKVSQVSCNYINRAPAGCTQYFYDTSGTGTIQSFNYISGYHLANQKQTICVRRERGKCAICWTAVDTTNDFMLSGKVESKGYSKGSVCCGYGADGKKTTGYDCIIIPGAQTKASAGAVMKGDSFCGRYLATAIATTTPKTICSRQVPFQISFQSDNWEVSAQEAMQTRSGFKLYYSQTDC